MNHKLLPIVISYSDFANFKRCRKLFDLSYLRGLAPKGDANEVMQTGTDIHKHLELAATDPSWPGAIPRSLSTERLDVVQAYLKYEPLPPRENIISAEEPLYVQVLEETMSTPAVYIRVTLDLIYTRGRNTVVGRDNKTFQVAPSYDVDLDYQGRIYSVMLKRTYPKNEIEFEWKYIRQVLGRELKGKGWVAWTEEERYPNVPSIVMNDIEIETTWRELQQVASDLLRAIDEQRMYRIELKVGPHSCDTCHFKVPCKAEYSHGALSKMDEELYCVRTDPAERATPKGMLADPRVQFHIRGQGMGPISPPHAAENAINVIYGKNGLDKFKEYANA